MEKQMDKYTDNVKLRNDGRAVVILDQSLLPGKTEYLELEKPDEMYEAIQKLRVRGAPAIGRFAAYCMAVLAGVEAGSADGVKAGSMEQAHPFMERMKQHGQYLKSSRPTAVNLAWAVDRVLDEAETALSGYLRAIGGEACGADHETFCEDFRGTAEQYIAREMKSSAEAIHMEDIRMCKAISEYGLSLVKNGDGILTHCNAGPLATSKYGTALGPILLGKERGIEIKVFADEPRPQLQGARLTSYELQSAGVDVTLICDNMASIVMKNGWVQACFVGCDRVAANGDMANKIGTLGVAILAKHYGIPFYVLGPTSTIDLNCATGDDIPIELREPEEIKEGFYKEPVAPAEVKCYNPAFDVTDNELITAIVTEEGICRQPFVKSLKEAKEKASLKPSSKL